MYRVSLLFLLLIVLSSVHIEAFSPHEEVFRRGVTAYEERNYELALQSFLHLTEEGIVNSELFYNIGNTYYRMNKLGYAVLYYKKGLKLQPHNKLLQNNLDYLLSLTTDRQVSDQPNPFVNLYRYLIYSQPLNTLLVLTLILFALMVFNINALIIFFKRKDKTIPLFLLTILTVLFLSVSAVSYYRWQRLTDDSEAVLLVSSTTGYSGPAEDFTNLFRIHEGMIFTVNRTDEKWSQITLPTGISGWIRNDTFQRVKF